MDIDLDDVQVLQHYVGRAWSEKQRCRVVAHSRSQLIGSS